MSFSFSLEPDISQIGQLEIKISTFCNRANISLTIQNQINLILEELFTNTVKYGFVDQPQGQVNISLTIAGCQLEIIYEDNGALYNPLMTESPNLLKSIADKKIGGYGVFFVKSLTDDVSYRSLGQWNQLIMLKRIVFN